MSPQLATKPNFGPISEAKTPDLRALPAALERASKAAFDLARQTNTCIIIQQNGEIVRLKVS